MRKRDIKVGMRVQHRAGKDMGVVTSVGQVLISGRYPSGSPWVAHQTELAPIPENTASLIKEDSE
jgi:hypothetical protein